MHRRLHALEGAAAFVALGILYALVSDRFTIGPPWLLLVLGLVGSIALAVLRYRGLMQALRVVAILLISLVTIAVALSAAYLLQALLQGRAQAGDLLVSAALLWISNVLAFGLWYWELDGGGPHQRHIGPLVSTDFLFPQMMSGGEHTANWNPEFLDYLFLAFNTSTAFSPTDTMVLARRAKLLMMTQSLISLVTVAVFAARAINTL